MGTRLEEVRARIAAACKRSEREPSEVTLVAVAKTFPADAIAAVARAGCLDIGENRAQELKQKAAVLGPEAIRWHFVGPLQTNKVRHVVGTAVLIHSVDRPGLAQAIARRAGSLGIIQDVLIEVNVAGEVTKTGVEPARLAGLAHSLGTMEALVLRGLMAIPPVTDDPARATAHFDLLASLRDEVAADIPTATELSMGMSRDYELAVERGSTIVRVGEAIFGPRTG